MTNVLPAALLPLRPMRARRAVFAGTAVKVFSGVLLVVMVSFMAVWQGPGIWRDIQISGDPVTMASSEVRNGQCTSRRFFTTCEADVRYNYRGKDVATHIAFAFIDFSSDDYTVEVVISEQKPQLATLDLGLDMLWNRIAVFFVLVGGLGVLGLWGLFGAWRSFSDNRAARRGGRVSPVLLTLTQSSKVLGGKVIAYRSAESKKSPVASARLKKSMEPIWFAVSDDTYHAVGVQMEGVRLPILLEDTLERLDFTDAERQASRAALPQPAGAAA